MITNGPQTADPVSEQPSVRLSMPAVAANVALVRQVLVGFVDDSVSAAECADMKIAVTEACTNVVVHAYPDGEGPLETAMTTLPGGLIVSVRDRGTDFKPLPGDEGTPALGFGMAMIASLSDEFSLRSGAFGTEVQMMFVFGDERPANVARAFAYASQLDDPDPITGEGIVVSIASDGPLVGVLGRVLSLLAARADFSIDRLSDAQLVSDALATHVPRRAMNGVVRVGVSENDDGFDLRIGPLQPNGGRALVADTALPGLGSLLERLTDEVAFETASDAPEGAEALRLRMSRGG